MGNKRKTTMNMIMNDTLYEGRAQGASPVTCRTIRAQLNEGVRTE